MTAMILHHFGDHQAMHDVLQGSGRRFKGPAATYRQLLLGIAAAGLGKTDEARTSMTKALELASACDSNQVAGETKIALGRLEASSGRTDAAENLLLQAAIQLGERTCRPGRPYRGRSGPGSPPGAATASLSR